MFAYIHNFPIQMICLEKCENTLDSLLEKQELDDSQMTSALFQIVMTLILYQRAFQFTHNDLHTNNIVYKTVDPNTVLEYIFLGKKYHVPTYGKIYKIIDFGRSIYRFQDQYLCSDSFAISGDAHSQYNMEPFFNEKKTRIEPNMSFDLCRLGCSLYDFIFENQDESILRKNRNHFTELQQTILRWCTDDFGKNILYKENGEERYPNFKLYKMISRIVHSHTPESQLSFSLFSQFEIEKNVSKKQKKKWIRMNLDQIPVYFTINQNKN